MRERNRRTFPTDPSTIDGVILTHAHLDHSGFLPRLVKEGFSGPIYCSKGTFDLVSVLLKDAAHLEEEFARYANETGYSSHKPAIPLFTRHDVDQVTPLLHPLDRHHWTNLSDSLSFRLLRAGHIPGASMVEVALAGEKPRRLVFSGDLGNDRLTTMKEPEPLPDCEVLILESTYGDRLQNRVDPQEELAAVIKDTYKNKGVLVVPAFAVGRSQEMIYLIKLLEDKGMIPSMPVVLDSPMAIEATKTFLAHPEDHSLDQTSSQTPLYPKKFETSITADDSMLHTMGDGPKIVISAAGMLSGGRILHHLKHRLPDETNTVLFTGYQAVGSKGRYLQENASSLGNIRIHGKEVSIEAKIITLDCLSSHQDYQDILEYLGRSAKKPKKIILNHGSEAAQLALAKRIQDAYGIDVSCAINRREYSLF